MTMVIYLSDINHNNAIHAQTNTLLLILTRKGQMSGLGRAGINSIKIVDYVYLYKEHRMTIK